MPIAEAGRWATPTSGWITLPVVDDEREADFAVFGKEWNIAFTDYFADALAALRPLADDGLVIIAPDKISVTPSGRLHLRNIGMRFDRYLKEAASKRPRYSRTA